MKPGTVSTQVSMGDEIDPLTQHPAGNSLQSYRPVSISIPVKLPLTAAGVATSV